MSLASNPTAMTLADARDAVRAKKISSAELTAAFVKAGTQGRELNAFITETPERAIEMANASDARRSKGEVGLLRGPERSFLDAPPCQVYGAIVQVFAEPDFLHVVVSRVRRPSSFPLLLRTIIVEPSCIQRPVSISPSGLAMLHNFGVPPGEET